MKKIVSFMPVFFLFCAWVYASLPLFYAGFIPTHDGEYHLIRIHEFFTMLSHGYAFPRWAMGLNSRYGLPLFNFHYPFPNYIGSLFHSLGFSLADSFKLTLAVGYGLGWVGCFFWLKKLFRTKAAIVGTLIAGFVPYWFIDIYVRGSVGEVLALGFIFCALAAIEYRQYMTFAVCIALVVISHNITALLFVPILCIYLYARKQPLLWMILGIGLATYFWLPAILERTYMVGLNSVNYLDHFPQLHQLLVPSWGTGFSTSGSAYDEMSQQIGIIPLVLLGITVFLFIHKQSRQSKNILGVCIGAFFLITFLLSDASTVVWQLVSPLQYVQYPWRLLSLYLPLVGFMGAYICHRTRKTWLCAVLVIGSMIITMQYVRPVVYSIRQDAYYLSKKEFTDGTSSLGNSFSTRWTDWKQTRFSQKIEVEHGYVEYKKELPLTYTYHLVSKDTNHVTIHTLYYPGWNVYIDGQKTHIEFEKQGVIEFVVPSGKHVVSVTFQETPLRRISNMISVCCLLWLFWLWYTKRNYAHRN